MLFLIRLTGLLVSCLQLTRVEALFAPIPRSCPTNFYHFLQHYRYCSPNHWFSSELRLYGRETLVGWDLLEGLKTFCSRLSTSRTCFMETYEDCQEDLVEILEESFAKSTWMCDEFENVRRSVVDALTAGNSSVPELETNATYCIKGSKSRNCIRETLERFPFLNRVRSMTIFEVLGNPNSTEYFYEMFDCAYDSMKDVCPDNALVMTLAKHSHMLFPPKFAINVSDIILHKVTNSDNEFIRI